MVFCRAAALRSRHFDGCHQCPLDRLDVVGVHDQRTVQILGGARELAEHKGASQVTARRNELLGNKVHPISKRRDHERIRRAEPHRHLAFVERGVHVDDRHRTVVARMICVDLGDQVLDLLALILVRCNVGTTGYRDLNERACLGVEQAFVEQLAERSQAL